MYDHVGERFHFQCIYVKTHFQSPVRWKVYMLLNDETDRIISSMKVKINAREYRSHSRGNQKWTIKRNWQHRVHKTQDEDKQSKNNNTICVGHHYAQTNTNNVNKTWLLLQTTVDRYTYQDTSVRVILFWIKLFMADRQWLRVVFLKKFWLC